jgi:hypothetical protein
MGYLRDIFRVLNLPCREHTALLSRQLDEPLAPGERLGLRLHLVYCRGCRMYRNQIVLLRSLAARLTEDLERGDVMPQDVRDRIARRAEEPLK